MDDSQIRLELFTESCFEKYSLFLSGLDNVSFFQSEKYISYIRFLLQADYAGFVAYSESDDVIGAIPALSKNGRFGVVINSLPFYGSNGGVLALDDDTAKKLIAAWESTVKKHDVLSSTVISSYKYDFYSNDICHNEHDYRIGQVTDFACAEAVYADLLSSFHQKTRNSIRKSMKYGFKYYERNDMLDYIFEQHALNMEVIGGKAKSKSFFSNLPNFFVAGVDYKVWVAFDNELPAAGLLLFYYKDTVEYFTPVVNVNYRSEQPLSGLIYYVMQNTLMEGYRYWNWGGTWAEQDSVYRFKNRFCAHDRIYNYYIQFNNKECLSLSPSELMLQYNGFYLYPFNKKT